MSPFRSPLHALRVKGPLTPRELRDALALSQSTVFRALRPLIGKEVLALGRTRSIRYAALRAVEGLGTSAPLLRVDEEGTATSAGMLHFLFEEGTAYERPDGEITVHGGLPWFLEDARPQGFLGRAFAAAHLDLGLPPLGLWQSNHVLRALGLRGEDLAGDLILGHGSAERFFRAAAATSAPLANRARARAYPGLARAALEGGDPGSSAGGEQPKFTARVAGRSGVRQVIVKFSPPTQGEVGRRWADLLVCEHLALEALRAHGLPASTSTLLESAGQVFLEVERFDRVGPRGRRPVVSMYAVNAELVGGARHWSDGAEQLVRAGQLSSSDGDAVKRLEAFGRMIQNSDRHLGNLAFFWKEGPRFALAPAYDMLPMGLRPQADQLVDRPLTPPIPEVGLLPVWEEMRSLARDYWTSVRADPRISTRFKKGPAAEAQRVLG